MGGASGPPSASCVPPSGRGLDWDLAATGLFLLGEADLQDAVAGLGLDAVEVDIAGQADLTMEGAEEALANRAGSLGEVAGGLLAAERQDIAGHRQVDRCRVDAGEFGQDDHLLGSLDDV